MKAGHVLGVVAVVGYLALEAVAAANARPRMEPDNIYLRLVEARVAADECGGVPAAQRTEFEAVLERVRARARAKLADAETAPDSAGVDAALWALTRSAEAGAARTLQAEGCDSADGRGLLRRHAIFARK
jgi:hypothetical protein